MKTVSMSGFPRESVGKKDAKALRRAGNVPCVLYGGEKQVQFMTAETEFKGLLFTPDTHYVELNINGEKKRAILQDIQYHPISDSVLHADFLEINDQSPITIAVPVKTAGVSPGVLSGGKLDIRKRKLNLKGLPNAIPQYVELNISKMRILDAIKIKDIQIPDVEIMEGKSNVVIQIKSSRAAAAAGAELDEELEADAPTEA